MKHRQVIVHPFMFLALAILAACTADPTPPPEAPDARDVAEPMVKDPVYQDFSAQAGVDFIHFNGASGSFFLPEIIGGGGALFDYDNDGDLDLFAAQGQTLANQPHGEALFPPAVPPRDRLYRNDLKPGPDGVLRPHFVDVSGESGLDDDRNTMGAATADYDRDGDVDLYVTRFGANSLYRNNGDGSFTDVTAQTGADDPRWSVSASFTDVDGDGFPDLIIGNYCDYAVAKNIACHQPGLSYCHPLTYPAAPDRLLRNRGDGSFEDISQSAGFTSGDYGRALGVLATDLTGDGQTDIYVANDGSVNQFWVNQGDGSFRDEALLAGNGLNESGLPEAGMGVDAQDLDGDGDQDLFVTHLMGETNTIYINNGTGVFEDQTPLRGLSAPSHPFTGFGTAFTDYDNDGDPDLLVVNGSVTSLTKASRAEFPYDQPNLLFENRGEGRFDNATHKGGPALARSEVSRGAAFGDLDNDGDEDVVIFNNAGPLRVLLNRVGNRNHWLGLSCLDERGGHAAGALVRLVLEDGSTINRRVRTDGSYACANDPRIILGLGQNKRYKHLEIRWPDGKTEQIRALEPDAWHVLRKGSTE